MAEETAKKPQRKEIKQVSVGVAWRCPFCSAANGDPETPVCACGAARDPNTNTATLAA